MGLFSNSFRSIKNGLLGSAKQVVTNAGSQAVFASVGKYRDYLTLATGQTESLFSALSVDAEMIADEFVEESVVQYDEDDPLLTEIDASLADDVIQGFSEACHNGQESVEMNGVTVTDGLGRAYNFIDQRAQGVVIDGKEILFSCTTYPSKIAEGIILRDVSTGKVYLNNFIRTSNFVKQQAQRVLPTSIGGIVASIQLIVHHELPGQYSIAGLIKSLSESASNTIVDMVNDWAQAVGLQYTNNVYETLVGIWHYYDEQYPLERAKGYISSIWAVVKDNYESSQLNSFILKACDIIAGGFDKTASITTLVTESIGSKFKSIRRFGSGVSSAYNRGGIYGVACYIISYIKELVSATADDDGTLHFTDNSSLVPKIYLAGLVSGLFTLVSTLLSVIVSIFSRIAGVALMILGTLISSFFKAIEYDYDDTNSAINNSDRVILPIAPYGMFQCEVSAAQVTNSDLLSIIEQGESMAYAEIPGGFLFIGPGSFNDDGSIATYRLECHPSVANSQGCCTRVIRSLVSNGYVSFEEHSVPNYYYVFCTFNELSGRQISNLRETIADAWLDGLTSSVLENQSNDRLSNADDAKLREYICKNMFIMATYISCEFPDCFNRQGYNGLISEYSEGQWRAKSCSGNIDAGSSGYWDAFAHWGFTNVQLEYVNLYFDPGSSSSLASPVSWSSIVDFYVDSTNGNDYSDGQQQFAIFNSGMYYDVLCTYSSTLESAIFIPKYDKRSFWATMIITMVVTALVAVAVTVAAVKVKKAIIKKRAVNEAKVAAAYDDLTKNPNDETYSAYRKAVKKNNLWATFIGGSKYDLESYWHGATNSDPGSTSGEETNPFNLAGIISPSVENDDQSAMVSGQIDATTTIASTQETNSLVGENIGDTKAIIRLIIGQPA